MKRIKKLNNFINEETAMFFDNREIPSEKVRFYLLNKETNKGFAFDVYREDKDELEQLLKRNDQDYDIDDGGDLPF